MRQPGGNPRNIFILTSSIPTLCMPASRYRKTHTCLHLLSSLQQDCLLPTYYLLSNKSRPIYKVESAAQAAPFPCYFIHLRLGNTAEKPYSQSRYTAPLSGECTALVPRDRSGSNSAATHTHLPGTCLEASHFKSKR